MARGKAKDAPPARVADPEAEKVRPSRDYFHWLSQK